MPSYYIVEITKYRYLKSITVYVPSSELGLSHPLSRQRVCPSPQNQREGGHTRLRVRGWGSPQFRRLEKSLALCILCGRDNVAPSLLVFNLFVYHVHRTCYMFANTHIRHGERGWGAGWTLIIRQKKVWYSSFYFLITLSLFNLNPIGTKGSIHCNCSRLFYFLAWNKSSGVWHYVECMVACGRMPGNHIYGPDWSSGFNAKSPSTKTQEERYNSNPFCHVELEKNTTRRGQPWFSA